MSKMKPPHSFPYALLKCDEHTNNKDRTKIENNSFRTHIHS